MLRLKSVFAMTTTPMAPTQTLLTYKIHNMSSVAMITFHYCTHSIQVEP